MEKSKIISLLQKHANNEVFTEEEAALFVALEKDKPAMAEAILEMLSLDKREAPYDETVWEPVLTSVLSIDKTSRPVPKIHFLRKWGWAAAVLLIIGAGTFLWHQLPSNKSTSQPIVSNTDIPAGSEKAMLTLADGSTIMLDSAVNGSLAQQGNMDVVKATDGQIEYRPVGKEGDGTVGMNTMHTPNGGEYRLVLPDGTKVWLNAASAITYPTAFTGAQRRVKIDGEVYFEVVRNSQKPFVVDVQGKTMVEVLGTTFNINAYGDAGFIEATLLEGSVRVSAAGAGQTKVLKPRQQARQKINMDAVGQLTVVNEIDIEKVVAWRNGLFNFDGMPLSVVMKQFERWYDIEVKYDEKAANLVFRGELYRNLSLVKALDILQGMGIKYQLNGRVLTIHGTT